MKQANYIVWILISMLLLGSCQKENDSKNTDPEELMGTWFRSYPNKVWGGVNQPSFERGETHIRVTFDDNGAFTYKKIVLGIYEGTSIGDTSAISIETGIYEAEKGTMNIILQNRMCWDAFYEDMEELEESYVFPHRYTDVTFEFINEKLNLVYFTQTDLVYGEQEKPGFEKYEEVYIKE